jgi:acyl-CoA thioesterase-1
VLLALIVLIVAGCRGQEEQPSPGNDTGEQSAAGIIVAMGNSLTAGLGVAPDRSFPALLERDLYENGYRYRVINAGVSGETSSGALSRVNWILKMDPDIVLIETGGNDGLRGIDPSLVRSNIEAVIQAFKDKGVVVVLAGMQMVANLGPDYLERFNRIYPELAAEYELLFIPFFLEGVAMQPELNQADAIHPNEAGYRVITGNLYPFVLEAIGQLERGNPNRALQKAQSGTHPARTAP